jgi:tetratricopeptide (TPR) repeat protein
MNLLKALFGGKEDTPDEKKEGITKKNFDVFKYDGVRALKLGENVYAIKCFKSALQIKEDLEVRDYLSQALLHNNELLSAYEQLQIISEAQPDNDEVFLMMARVAYILEDYKAMGEACEKAMTIDSKKAETNYLFSEACLGQGDSINAIAMLTKAISLNTEYSDAYLLRGKTLLRMGDTNGAEQDADYLLKKDSDNEDALLLKARIERERKQYENALVYYNKVIDVNPFAIDAYRERGSVRYDIGDNSGATEDMQKVLELDPKQVTDISGEYSAEGVEQKTKNIYRNIDPYGIFS